MILGLGSNIGANLPILNHGATYSTLPSWISQVQVVAHHLSPNRGPVHSQRRFSLLGWYRASLRLQVIHHR
jgi:hypothetical protein